MASPIETSKGPKNNRSRREVLVAEAIRDSNEGRFDKEKRQAITSAIHRLASENKLLPAENQSIHFTLVSMFRHLDEVCQEQFQQLGSAGVLPLLIFARHSTWAVKVIHSCQDSRIACFISGRGRPEPKPSSQYIEVVLPGSTI